MKAVFLHNIMLLPIILPLICGAALLFIDERQRLIKAALTLVSAGLLVIIAALLVYRAQDMAPQADVYNLGGWAAPFGIIFALDRLAAIFLLMTALIGLSALIYASAHWHKMGAHFYSFSLFFLAGLNGVFLTGDIFNLFVFFEIMLAASYALLMHGSGLARVRAGINYVAVNLLGSSCFLIGAALLYGGAGTLNMADLASELRQMQGDNLTLCQIGIVLIGMAFLIKAGIWPLCFWAPATYSAAAAPVGALFAITGKVGLYAILRLSLLLLAESRGAGFAASVSQILFYGGVMTLIFGFIGALAAQSLPRLCANFALVSGGTALAAIGLNSPALTSIAVYYILSSTFALAAFFLLAEPIERSRDAAADILAVTMEVYGDDEEEEEYEIGFSIPANLAILGACFALCAILLIGMPPLSGFISKFMLIEGVFWPQGMSQAAIQPNAAGSLFIIMLLIAGFAQLIALTRAGIRIFWTPPAAQTPKMQIAEILPIGLLLAFCFIMTIGAAPIMRYLDSMSADLHSPANYIHSVLGGAAERGE